MSDRDPDVSAVDAEALRRREALRKMAQMAGVGGVSVAVLMTSRRARAASPI